MVVEAPKACKKEKENVLGLSRNMQEGAKNRCIKPLDTGLKPCQEDVEHELVQDV